MAARIAVVGGGINGLVAANYLARNGASVTLYEARDEVGGACVSDTLEIDGVSVDYPLGATVLGFMQRFVFEETGLAERLELWAPEHAKLVHFEGEGEPVRIHRHPDALEQELRDKCGEQGDVAGFRRDEGRVVRFLQQGYRDARPPRLDDARRELGDELCARFIEGSARALLDHYFTSDRTKLYMGMTVIESGPVSLDAPSSAFNVPLLDSGSVFGGYYGFVRGGIWQITRELAALDAELGVRIVTSAEIGSLDDLDADRIVLATDPVTAGALTGAKVRQREYLGTSAKMTFFFGQPVRWKDDPEADTTFRFLFANRSLDEMESAAQTVTGDTDYAPGYIQLYSDGAGMRRMGHPQPFERLVAFVKNVRFGPTADELPEVADRIREQVLARIDNPEALAATKFLAPKDLEARFRFPQGNVDHTMMTTGQNFSERHFSSDPENDFYRFGDDDRIYYCGSGAYPCGSIAGTPGYMCATQMSRSLGLIPSS